MSFTDPNAEPVQPDPGQGGESTGGGSPWADLLDRVPEDARGDFESRFRDWDSNYTRTSQEYSEHKKAWEPYEQAGVTQYPADQIPAAFNLLNDPEQLKTWYEQTYGPLTPEQQQQQAPEADPYGFQDPAQQQLEQLLEQKLGPVSQQLEQLGQWRQQFEQQQHVAQIQSQLDAEINALKEQHGANLPEPVRENFEDIIERFGGKYAEAGDSPKQVVAKAWADWQNYANAIEKAVLQSKVDAPKPAEGGGVADVTPQTRSRMDKQMQADAVEFLKQSNRM